MARQLILVVAVLICLAAMPLAAHAGILAYGACQTGCNAAAVACYAAAGAVMGVMSVPACNIGLSACMATLCAPALLAPTP